MRASLQTTAVVLSVRRASRPSARFLPHAHAMEDAAPLWDIPHTGARDVGRRTSHQFVTLEAATVLRKVDLSAPFRPSSATIPPCRTSSRASCRMWLLP